MVDDFRSDGFRVLAESVIRNGVEAEVFQLG